MSFVIFSNDNIWGVYSECERAKAMDRAKELMHTSRVRLEAWRGPVHEVIEVE